ncbi:hypothetical protein M878_20410 [Streptomyces roseochromogenus subsp. oscitans DS 12.976]|uniref:Uncharacterized protein n=1 Tax=Streptomyces roseochromogenus subsp. oscitans DS 12.976 TaxID=1352936 RepID=V6KKQ0_STRRC|nr:hypothetical protein M878_20410 [Streptomyces roseochromogenus subsp. oscitans DS 12.976]
MLGTVPREVPASTVMSTLGAAFALSARAPAPAPATSAATAPATMWRRVRLRRCVRP